MTQPHYPQGQVQAPGYPQQPQYPQGPAPMQGGQPQYPQQGYPQQGYPQQPQQGWPQGQVPPQAPAAPLGPIQWRTGEFHALVSTHTFSLTNINISLYPGQRIEYDGTTVVIDGQSYTSPNLKGAYRAGWLVREEEYDPNGFAAPVAANIPVRHATNGGNPMQGSGTIPRNRMAIATIESDERMVGNAVQHARHNRARTAGFHQARQRAQVRYEVEEQDGRDVGRQLQTPGFGDGQRHLAQPTRVTYGTVGAELAKANAVTIQPGQGISQEEMFNRMTPEQQEIYLAEKDLLAGNKPIPARYQEGTTASRAINSPKQRLLAAQQGGFLASPYGQRPNEQGQGVIVGHAPMHNGPETREGITAAVSFGAGISTFDPSTGAGPAHQQTVEAEGITFSQTNGPRRDQAQRVVATNQQPAPYLQPAGPVYQQPQAAPPTRLQADYEGDHEVLRAVFAAEIARKVAKQICPAFPDNYDFTLPPKKKLARLQADYEGNHEVLRAVFAAEADSFKAILVSEFPDTFSF